MPPTPSILVIGDRGLLGRACREVLSGRFPVAGVDIERCDITRPDRIESILDDIRPGWMINTAAVTDVDGCEAAPDRAWEVNARGAANLAAACRERGIRLLQLSTDFVFDGRKDEPYREEDAPRPLSVYGKSKRGGEEAVAKSGAEFLIVRTSWLFGPGGKNFPETILRAARKTPRLEVVSDQRGSPTYSPDLAAGLGDLIENNAAGIVHLTNRGDCSWYEYAVFVLRTAGIAAEVVPVSSGKLARPAPRPCYSVLSLEKYRRITGKYPRPWPEAVREFLGNGE